MKTLLLSSVLLALAACGKGTPSQPANGAPMIFEVQKVDGDTLTARGYNFSDKTIAGYQLCMRWKDKAGALLKAADGSDFSCESVQGPSLKSAPRTWSTLVFKHLDVPAGATTAEMVLGEARSLAADGASFEDQALWSSGSVGSWPDPGKKSS